MEYMNIKKSHRVVLWIVAGIGLLGINGVFLYSVIFRPEIVREGLTNLYSLVFIIEAFILLPLLSFLIAIAKLKSPDWLGFLVLSLLGSLAFSIPISILLWTRGNENIILQFTKAEQNT